MIGRADIVERVREWGLREDVIEKDYVLGWLLWGIGTDADLGDNWVFKGGTCIKKCYIETYRFSEDLDFTVLPGGPVTPEEVLALLDRVLVRITQESGIDYSVETPRLRVRRPGSAEGRVYYRGPRGTPVAASVKLDLSALETVVRPPVLRAIAHPYPDGFPSGGTVRCYAFEELFAEKIRAMGERGRPRDLYDIITLFWRHDLQLHTELIREVLEEKCRTKGVPVPTAASCMAAEYLAELRSEWANMLGHQLPALPPVDVFLNELSQLFAWLEGTVELPALEAVAVGADEDVTWSPPPVVASWGSGIPLETIRFAAANRLCVELGYLGTTRVIEPYALRMTRAGNLVLHAIRVQDRGHRSYRIDQIESVRVTTTPFAPVHAIEFSAGGPLAAPPARRSSGFSRPSRGTSGTRPSTGPQYVIQCAHCNKRFYRKKRDTALRPHKSPDGWKCSGRRGHIVDVR